MSQFVTLGSINCFGVFFQPLQDTFDVGSASLAAVVSLANFVAPLVGTLAGSAADRYGAQGLIAVAAVCQFASYFGASASSSYVTLLLCYGLPAGIAAGCTISPCLRLVGQWFEESRSTAMGVAFGGAGLGQVVLPPLASILVKSFGWRSTFRCLSGLSLVVLLSCAVMKRRIVPEGPTEQPFFTPWVIFRTRGFKQLCLVGFLFSYGFFIPIVHVAFCAQSHGIGPFQAGTLLSVLGLFTTMGNVIWGGFADKYGNMEVFRICHFVSGLALCMWPYCISYPSLLVFVMIAGFFNGGCVTCYPALAAEIFPPEHLGGAISLIYTGFGMGSLVGPIATGWLVDTTGTYDFAAVAGGTAFFLALWVASSLPAPDEVRPLLGANGHND